MCSLRLLVVFIFYLIIKHKLILFYLFRIIPEEGVVTETQLPEESMIANLAMMEDHLVRNGLDRANRYHDDIRPTNPPNFLKPLAPQVGLRESAPAHFETCVEPTNDPSLTVEWYKDGKPVSMGMYNYTFFYIDYVMQMFKEVEVLFH